MTHAFKQRCVPHKTVPGILLVLAMMAFAVAPPVSASGRSAAVTTMSVSYAFKAQLVHGTYAGWTLYGWLSGTQDSTGLITTTVTMGDANNAPVTENANGNIIGHGSSAMALIAVTPIAGSKGSSWALAGAPAGKAGQWAGTITQGSSYAGTWTMAPATGVTIDAGGKSAASSKDKVVLSGRLSLNMTADGWAVGTYGTFDNSTTVVVQGWVVNGNIEVGIPMGKTGAILLAGWSKQGFGVQNWTGSFVGPAKGDYGTWLGRG